MFSAFEVSEDQILTLGYPNTDLLFDEKVISKYKSIMYNRYPLLKDKKVILYAPTFRVEAVYDEKKVINVDLVKIANCLGDDSVLLYKFNPIISNTEI